MPRKKLNALIIASFCALLTLLGTGAAYADDWVAVKLRGRVFAFDGADWVQLKRGDVVSDERVIRTTGGGRVQFERDAETINVGGNSQIRIYDRAGQRYTTVQQHFGVVTIEAEKENVQHFAVQTPFLAAVVKGTRFTVRSNAKEAKVDVVRGKVEVNDDEHDMRVNVTPGQSASAGATRVLHAEGKGKVEQVVTLAGRPVVVKDEQKKLDRKIARDEKEAKENAERQKNSGKGKSSTANEVLSKVDGVVSGKSSSKSNKGSGLSRLFDRGRDDKSDSGQSRSSNDHGNDNSKGSNADRDRGNSNSDDRDNDKKSDKSSGKNSGKNSEKGKSSDKDNGRDNKGKGLVGGLLGRIGGHR